MTALAIRAASDCRWDVVALGEVMLRLDPGEGRVRSTRSFRVSEGGGEYNVARGLRKVFGLRASLVSALGSNEVGALVEDLILQGGVDTSHLVWKPVDGIGLANRNSLNFTERGYGVRGALGISDRGHSASSALDVRDVDWDDLFAREGVRWLHTGGIFAGLSASTAEVAAVAAAAARRHGTVVSYDLNYRPSIWQAHGGLSRAHTVNQSLAKQVDVLFGNEEDFASALGYDSPPVEVGSASTAEFERTIAAVAADYPNLSVVATSLRKVHSASVNSWGALAWSRSEGFVNALERPQLEIFDRVGGGDSFAAGLIFGLMTGRTLREAVELGTAHGALAMTTPGDTSMATVAEVERLAAGGDARVQR
ncbi:MAG: sugar kinase [Actinomycetes bacterium]